MNLFALSFQLSFSFLVRYLRLYFSFPFFLLDPFSCFISWVFSFCQLIISLLHITLSRSPFSLPLIAISLVSLCCSCSLSDPFQCKHFFTLYPVFVPVFVYIFCICFYQNIGFSQNIRYYFIKLTKTLPVISTKNSFPNLSLSRFRLTTSRLGIANYSYYNSLTNIQA